MRIARGLLVVVALGGACRRAAPSSGKAEGANAAAPVLEVQVTGCSAVLRGGVCEASPGTQLHLWLPGAEGDTVRVEAGDRELPVVVTTWPDGRTANVTLPAEAVTELRVHARKGAGDAAGRVTIAPPAPVPPVVERARRLRSEGKFDEALKELDGDPDAGESGTIVSLRARIAYQMGRVGDAIADLRVSMPIHEAAGRVSQACEDAAMLTYLYLERDRFGEARTANQQERALATDYPEGRAFASGDEASLATRTGDLRSALRLSREASELAARLGADRRRRTILSALGHALRDLGRYRDAIAVARDIVAQFENATDVTACERADRLDDIAWGALLAVEADPRADVGVDPRESAEQALALLRADCPDPNRFANTLENLVLADLQGGRLDEARTALAEAKAQERDPPAEVAIFWHQMAGRLALASGRAGEALRAFTTSEDMATAMGSVGDGLGAAEGRAAALEALGRKREALAALDGADARIDALSSSVPLGEGMATFLQATDRAALHRVELLVSLGRAADAFDAARRWRARMLQRLRVALAMESLGPAERARWQDAVGRYRAMRDDMDAGMAHEWELPADQLAAARARREAAATRARAVIGDALSSLPGVSASDVEVGDEPSSPGELELLYLPEPSGWFGFARTAGTVTVARLPAIDPSAAPAALAEAVFGPFDAAIAAATRVRLLPYRGARSIDFHALPWHGRPLLDHAPVEYGLGLAGTPSGQPTTSLALVVADPEGNLPAARAEADAVSKALEGGGRWQVKDVRGSAADGETLRGLLNAADLLHYAGHASYGGADGMESALLLAHGNRLTPADVLALPHVPPIVTLFGCDTGRESASGAVDALGLSAAFLVAGAHSVVATSREIDDGLARDVAGEFYARLVASSAPSPDAAAALREAAMAVRDRSPGVDWSAFRVLVP